MCLLQVPQPNHVLIKGVVRGVPAEEAADPLARETRSLDKPADQLAWGKSLAKLSQKY
ncbi:MAG: DUF2200 domain-containing protein [Acutalibacter sp.]|nr:DUF2200 domain-containing protein [Acutalibacter sp.]